MREDKARFREARHVYSRAGLGLFAALLLELLFSVLLDGETPLLPLLPEQPVLRSLVLDVLPVYAATLAAWLIMRRAPAHPPKRRSLSARQFLKLPPITTFLEYTASGLGGALLMLAGLLLSVLLPLDGTAAGIPAAENPVLEMAQRMPRSVDFAFTVLLAPVVEEFVFRRTLLDRARVYGEKLALVSSALLFGLFHHNFSQLFYTVALGLLFGLVYLRTGKLRYCIALHVYNNLLGFLVSLLVLSADLQAYTQGAELSGASLFGLASLLLGLAALFLCGMVLFFRGVRQLRFETAEWELPPSQRFRAAWCGAGSVAFVLMSLLFSVAELAF